MIPFPRRFVIVSYMIKILAAGFSVLVRDICIWLYCLPQKYSRLRCLLLFNGLMNCFLFGLGWQYSTNQNQYSKGSWSKPWLLTCSSNITLSLPSYIGSDWQSELNFHNGYLSLLYFWSSFFQGANLNHCHGSRLIEYMSPLAQRSGGDARWLRPTLFKCVAFKITSSFVFPAICGHANIIMSFIQRLAILDPRNQALRAWFQNSRYGG